MKFGGQNLNAIHLIVAFDDTTIDRNIYRIAADHSRGKSPLQILWSEERLDDPGVGLNLPVPETHLFAVRQKDERHFELLCIGSTLSRGVGGINRRSLRLHDR